MSEYTQVPTSIPPKFGEPRSFDEAAEELQNLINWAKEAEHRIGYFAAVYKRTTLALKQAADDGVFEDADSMGKLAELFATRYLTAVNAFFRPDEATLSKSWLAAFEQLDKDEPVIVQHIQAGINAHVLYDLAMAVNVLTSSTDVNRVRNDFLAVNAVLASQTHDMLARVEEISPGLKDFLDAVPGDEARLIGPAITWMREGAWMFVKALELYPGTRNLLPSEVQDNMVSITTTTLFSGLSQEAFDAIAEHESRDVRRNIEVLDRVADQVASIKTTM